MWGERRKKQAGTLGVRCAFEKDATVGPLVARATAFGVLFRKRRRGPGLTRGDLAASGTRLDSVLFVLFVLFGGWHRGDGAHGLGGLWGDTLFEPEPVDLVVLAYGFVEDMHHHVAEVE